MHYLRRVAIQSTSERTPVGISAAGGTRLQCSTQLATKRPVALIIAAMLVATAAIAAATGASVFRSRSSWQQER